MAATNGLAENPGLLPEDPALLRARLDEVEALYAQVQVQFRELRTWYDKLKRQHRELLWSEAVLAREGLEEAMPGPPIADADRANGHIGGGFVLRHHLGAGAFATVYAAIDKEGRPCAVKRIDKYHIKSLESLRNVAGELRALRAAVGCPNLVWVRGVVASETYLSFVMELFGTSNLQEAGAARPQDVRRAAPRIVRGVANGLAHLHARDLHHRDIKPENVLFDGTDVKLCDFGLTTPCRRDASGARLFFPQRVTGSLGFFAPEMLHPEGYDGPPADVWSAGVLALEVLIGTPDFDALWFVAYNTEYKRGTLMQDRRADDGADAHAHFCGVLAPIVDALADGATALGALVARHAANAEVAGACRAMLRLDPSARPTAAAVRDGLTTETVVTEL